MISQNNDDKIDIEAAQDIIHAPAHDAHDDHEHEEHIDERWLVSYADMMTLLFGLFVLLYSMKSPEDIKKMQESIEQKFSSVKVKSSENQESGAKEKIASLQEEIAKLKEKNEIMSEKISRNIASLELQPNLQSSQANEVKKKDSELVEKGQIIDELKKQNEELANKLSSYKNFFAIIINWSTSDHDIDFSVTDPAGHNFDFKHRSFDGVPGAFALDTRRGPGTEVWQAEDLMSGEYKAEIKFYNQNGNTQNAKVKMIIFSTRGKLEVPEFEMDFKSSRNKTILFTVNEEGRVSLK
ncbi:MAG: hypothetical protein A2Z20_02065 [Bdellovibrionales bacterium RBG_16_40_8]|nr:MAG: hypothetical protein A2Z20_02065 [Bdellovibrionales bacterium RBG_16_40_8]